ANAFVPTTLATIEAPTPPKAGRRTPARSAPYGELIRARAWRRMGGVDGRTRFAVRSSTRAVRGAWRSPLKKVAGWVFPLLVVAACGDDGSGGGGGAIP